MGQFVFICRCKSDGIGSPKLKMALTYEPQTDDLIGPDQGCNSIDILGTSPNLSLIMTVDR